MHVHVCRKDDILRQSRLDHSGVREEWHLEGCTQPDRRLPLMKDDLRWKTTFNGRWPSMEDNLRWKTTFNGGRYLMEDDLWWKTTFNGSRPLMEGRRPQKFKKTSRMRTTDLQIILALLGTFLCNSKPTAKRGKPFWHKSLLLMAINAYPKATIIWTLEGGLKLAYCCKVRTVWSDKLVHRGWGDKIFILAW